MFPTKNANRIPLLIMYTIGLGFSTGTLALGASQLKRIMDQENETSDYQVRLGVLLFAAGWSIIFVALHWLANTLFVILWSALTLAIWTVVTSLLRSKNQRQGYDYYCSSFDQEEGNAACQLRAVEALGWVGVAIAALYYLLFLWVWHVSKKTQGGTWNDAMKGRVYTKMEREPGWEEKYLTTGSA